MNDHTLEKMKIHDRLLQLEKQVNRLIAQLDSGQANLERMEDNLLDKIQTNTKLLRGNGGEGLVTLVDRNKQVIDGWRTHLRMLWGVVILTACTALAQVFF